MTHDTKESGFALLITLIVVGAVLSVGLSMLDLSIKQVKLSTNAKDSEIAFHAANAGMECAQKVRNSSASLMESGNAITPSCFNGSLDSNTVEDMVLTVPPGVTITNISGGALGATDAVNRYDYKFNWDNPNPDRCTEIYTLVVKADIAENGIKITGMPNVPGFSGFPADVTDLVCTAGSTCTVMSVKGYNQSCGNISARGTVEREVLLQL